MRLKAKIMLSIILFIILFSSQVLADENMSVIPQRPLPVLNLYCDFRLFDLLDEFADGLREKKVVDIHISSGRSEQILDELKNDPQKADIVILQSKEAIMVGNKLGLLEPKEVISIASDRLVVIAHKGKDIASPISFIEKVEKGRIVIADPKTNFSGLHADQALKRVGLGQKVDGKLRHMKTDEQAVLEVAKGNADITIVYLSSSYKNKYVKSILTMPKNSYFPIVYFAVPLKHLDKNKKMAAKAILTKLASMENRDLWMKYGFSPPPKNMP